MKQKQKLHERFGLSVEESLNRLIWLGQLLHKWEQTHFGEKLNPAHLEAVLNANTLEMRSEDSVFDMTEAKLKEKNT